jgi:hypothetical protein
MAADEPEEPRLAIPTVTPKEYAKEYELAPLNEPLGAIVMAFATLESKLSMTINALLGLQYPKAHAMGIALDDLMQSTTSRIKLFHTLAVIHTDGIFIHKLSGRSGLRASLETSNAHRNDLIHGEWTGINNDGTFTKVRYKADRGLHPVKSTINVSIDDLWKAHAFIFRTALRLEEWRSAFNWRDTPQLWPVSWRNK